MARKFHLAWFTWQGTRDWDDPGRGAHGALEWTRPTQWQEMAKVLEDRALFDMIIFADENAMQDVYQNSHNVYVKYGLEGMMHDPVPLMAMIAMHTSKIGFVSTLNTSVFPPYLLARVVSTLDHLSRGRIGWNIVTGAKSRSAQNLGLSLEVGHDERYNIADDYLKLCRELWESWAADAVEMNATTGRFADLGKVARRETEGRRFDAAGPLTLPRSPQVQPVIVQAGGSDRGRQFAAENAEVIITHQNTVAEMRAFRDDIRGRVAALGRDPDRTKILFTIKPIVGQSTEDAAAVRKQLLNAPTISVEVGLAQWPARIGRDLSVYDVNQPLPSTPAKPTRPTPGKSTVDEGYSEGHLRQHYRDGKAPILRDVAMQEAIKETFTMQGDPRHIAQHMAEVMAEVGGDGFAIRGSMLPRNVIAFTDRVVPELRRLGVVREAYTGATLRDHLQAF